jgi:hypothetical protein
MTDDKKKDDPDHKKVSDEEMEDVAGGYQVTVDTTLHAAKGKKKPGFRGDGVTKAG